MSTWSLRAAMVPITRRVRAYFAPVDRQTETPAIFDPGKHGAFPLDAPPAPWLDLGWVDHFQRSCGTSTEALRASTRGSSGGTVSRRRWTRAWNSISASGASCRWRWRRDRST